MRHFRENEKKTKSKENFFGSFLQKLQITAVILGQTIQKVVAKWN